MTSPATATIGGVTIIINDVAAVMAAVQPLYRKEDRAGLSDDKRNELFERATRKTGNTKFGLLSLSLSDDEKLDDTYNLSMLIGKTKDAFVQYDMHNVFSVLELGPDNKTVLGERDLFHDYPSLNVEVIAKSNAWYRKWPQDPTYQQNLQLTYKFFQNNVDDTLWEKCYERYSTYPPVEQGGPLFFAIMLHQLVSNTEEAARSLQLRLEKLNISDIAGENVDKAVSQIRGAIGRLVQINKLPEDLTRKLLAVFQTTSVDDFNATFKHLEHQRTLDTIVGRTSTNYDYDRLCGLAEQLYHEHLETGSWTGVTTKSKGAIFVQVGSGRTPTCWNCGDSGHMLTECPKPANAQDIAKNKETFLQHRGDDNSKRRGTKFALPKEGENSKRVIDGKPMYFNPRMKRWVEDRDVSQASVASAAPPATPAPVPAIISVPPLVGTTAGTSVASLSNASARNQAIDVAMANATRNLSAALAGLADQFRE